MKLSVLLLRLAYVAECYYGDTLSFFCQQEADEDIRNVEIRKNGEETVCRAKIEFR